MQRTSPEGKSMKCFKFVFLIPSLPSDMLWVRPIQSIFPTTIRELSYSNFITREFLPSRKHNTIQPSSLPLCNKDCLFSFPITCSSFPWDLIRMVFRVHFYWHSAHDCVFSSKMKAFFSLLFLSESSPH